MRLVDGGISAVEADRGFAEGFNVVAGKVTNAGVAEAHDMDHVPLHDAMR